MKNNITEITPYLKRNRSVKTMPAYDDEFTDDIYIQELSQEFNRLVKREGRKENNGDTKEQD